MTANDFEEEKNLLRELEKKSLKAFIKFYADYSPDLNIEAFNIINDSRISRREVNELFEEMWEGNEFPSIQPPVRKFLSDQLRQICKRKYPARYAKAYPDDKN